MLDVTMPRAQSSRLWQRPWQWVVRSQLPPMALTTLAALLGFGAALAAAAGRLSLSGILFFASGLCDALDGKLARAQNSATPAGAALDSVLDRYVDGLLLVGLAWIYRQTWVLGPVLGALIGTSIVPYVRARGEGLGVSVRGGVMQRAGRVILLGTGLLAGDWLGDVPLIVALCLLAALSNLTAIQRLIQLLHSLGSSTDTTSSALPLRQLLLNSTAAIVATAVDFCVVVTLVRFEALPPPWATALGAMVGGAVNYSLNRFVTFRSRGSVPLEARRYVFVSVASALLSAGGVALVTLLPEVGYVIGWLIVRALVFGLWNFPLHRRYVFIDR